MTIAMLRGASRRGVSGLLQPISRRGMSAAASGKETEADMNKNFKDKLKPWRGTNLQPLRIKAHGIQVLQVCFEKRADFQF
jgi:hypothetical protein